MQKQNSAIFVCQTFHKQQIIVLFITLVLIVAYLIMNIQFHREKGPQINVLEDLL